MKWLMGFFAAVHAVVAALFVGVSLMLLLIAIKTGWSAVGAAPQVAAEAIIETIGLLAVAVVALQIAQTIIEEEVIRNVQISAPTRVRRYLSRFLVVVVVALAVEGMVATFKALHEKPELLPHAATILISVGILLIGWGAFIWFNRVAEVLEPEAMKQAQQEDEKLE
ncbi:hypothetical protein [Massilia psychrophila]|jgi:glucan phosphoethanolaminetransferase (alkaline phosphatase superfamily)|uniref:GNAT family acetyltransferase n=1 Tax=Massilia psychrophila TaxID=1603353 RepID=A0A2G8SVU5_9BURK|nr:hypothetical protein [Massilia psychrophila]PIL37905.1 hypothetical protein CR103_20835 [Massilia psychrophila]GGE89695.1 hypothetical protein GCM10008020_38460 [Massilia psychrophila]